MSPRNRFDLTVDALFLLSFVGCVVALFIFASIFFR